MSIKAFALHSIHRRDENDAKVVVPASVTGKPSVFETTQEEFDKLEALGAVRKPTKEEILIAKANSDAANGVVAPKVSKQADASDKTDKDASTTAPKSGAAGDPKGSATGAKSTEGTSKLSADEI